MQYKKNQISWPHLMASSLTLLNFVETTIIVQKSDFFWFLSFVFYLQKVFFIN